MINDNLNKTKYLMTIKYFYESQKQILLSQRKFENYQMLSFIQIISYLMVINFRQIPKLTP